MYRLFPLLALSLLLTGCSLLNIHFQVHNPKKAGSYPKETETLRLLAAPSTYRSCFDVTYYGLNVGLNPEKKYLTGSVQIGALAKADFDTLQLDLYANMQLNFIKMNGQPLKYTRKAGAIWVFMPQRMKAGATFSIYLSYEGKPVEAHKPPWDGGFVWKQDENKNPWIGVACESEGASLWWPNKDDVSDEPDSADITITVPEGLMAVSNGVLQKQETNVNKTQTCHWHVSYPINNYNITFYVGKLQLVQDTFTSALTGKVTQLNHYVLPQHAEIAKTHFQQAKEHLAFYERMFGEYPWQRDGFKLVESPYAGMEHQSAIAYGNKFKNDTRNKFDYIILHETAHEWWGNSVSAADLADGWIHEGFASYCEALYVEATQNHSAYINYMLFQRIMIQNKRPLVRKRGIRYFDYHDQDIYTKGSWVLHTLRNEMRNDSLFFDILKTFRLENHQKQIFSETFIELVNRKTGKNYQWFFNQYLYNRKAPILEYFMTAEGLYYRWTETAEDFNMPVELITPSGDRITLYPTRKTKLKRIRETQFSFNQQEILFGLKENLKLNRDYTPQ